MREGKGDRQKKTRKRPRFYGLESTVEKKNNNEEEREREREEKANRKKREKNQHEM